MTDAVSPGPEGEAPLAATAEAAGARTLRRNVLSMPEVLAQSVSRFEKAS